jgi:hypothetical protein
MGEYFYAVAQSNQPVLLLNKWIENDMIFIDCDLQHVTSRVLRVSQEYCNI